MNNIIKLPIGYIHDVYMYIVGTTIKKTLTTPFFATLSMTMLFYVIFYEYTWAFNREYAKFIQLHYGLMHKGLILFLCLSVILAFYCVLKTKEVVINRLFILVILFVFFVHTFSVLTSVLKAENMLLFETINMYIVWGTSIFLSFISLKFMEIHARNI